MDTDPSPRRACRILCAATLVLVIAGGSPAAAQPDKQGEWLPTECYSCFNCVAACGQDSIDFRFQWPWRKHEHGRIDLTLEPDFDDSTVLALGPPLTLTRWKVHGEIVGNVGLDDGSTLRVEGVRGAAEYVEIVW